MTDTVNTDKKKKRETKDSTAVGIWHFTANILDIIPRKTRNLLEIPFSLFAICRIVG